jgi:hypothetical protein
MNEEPIEIRVKLDSDRIYGNVMKAHLVRTTCTTCGRLDYCVAYVHDMRAECKACYCRRRAMELEKELSRPKLDVQDFARI